MRPDSIAAFEGISFASLVLSAVQYWLQWQHITAVASTRAVAIVLFAIFASTILLILAVARGRSRIAKNLLILSFVLSMPAVYKLVNQNGITIQTILALMNAATEFIGFYMLCTPSAIAWLRKRG